MLASLLREIFTDMGLLKYKTKRNFKESPEPTGGNVLGEKLRFVIQKHDATHLHYDFRLEMAGVLKSWAVPKGPSLNPSVKRLAMMVEDHPYDYRTFEGIIPSGYGAGTVIVWDEGFYEPIGGRGKDKKTMTRELTAGLKKGKLHILIKGKKLKGEFGLIKAFGKGENAWLLFKVKDQHASPEDILLKDQSVISKKTLAQIEKSGAKIYSQNNTKKRLKKKTAAPPKKASGETQRLEKKSTLRKPATPVTSIKGAIKSKFQNKLSPILATLVDQAFDAEGWLYEIKWDGYRAMAFMNKGVVALKSRNGESFNEKFYPIYRALSDWQVNAIVDGEIVVLNKNGISNFGALQNWRSEADGDLLYYVFDLLWLDGKNLMFLPLTKRKEILKSIVPGQGLIRISDTFSGSGKKFFEAARSMGLEGIIAKKADSIYTPGLRSDNWLKIKSKKRQEMVIGGYTKNDDSSKPFSSLLVGVFKKGELVYTGRIGTGFSIQTQKDMIKQFKALITKKSPFIVAPHINKPSRFRPDPPHASLVFLKPKLVCEVSFAEMTRDGVMRHPSFEGMRMDKTAETVIAEREIPAEKIVHQTKKAPLKKLIQSSEKKERKTLLNPYDETQVRQVNGHEMKFTNLNKIYWPDVNVTKRDMLNYYYQVAPYILPYLKNRPQSMNRHPDGIKGKSFFYKDVTGKAPGWIETFLYKSSADQRERHYLVAKDDASLLYMASLGCIEMNPWSSRVETDGYPDWCVIDLDPGKTTFEQVIKAAQVTKNVLDELGVPCYPKTSGSKGIHIFVPLGARYTYEQSKEFARAVVTIVRDRLSDFTSITRTVKDRKGKMYLDFLQNRAQATISAPYSLRPKPGATVSMPLHWDEVKKGLKLTDFTIFNTLKRIKSEGDLFKPVLGKGIDLEKTMKKFKQ